MGRLTKILLASGVTALVIGCATASLKYNSSNEWVAGSFTGQYLPLAAGADIWSDPKPFNAKTGKLTVQSRFTGQKGTTCDFTIQFNNSGSTSISENVIVTRPGKAAVSVYDSPLKVKLAPGKSVAYGTEVRECPPNWGETKEMAKCASCEPIVYFVAH